jgi:hypothetical protein
MHARRTLGVRDCAADARAPLGRWSSGTRPTRPALPARLRRPAAPGACSTPGTASPPRRREWRSGPRCAQGRVCACLRARTPRSTRHRSAPLLPVRPRRGRRAEWGRGCGRCVFFAVEPGLQRRLLSLGLHCGGLCEDQRPVRALGADRERVRARARREQRLQPGLPVDDVVECLPRQADVACWAPLARRFGRLEAVEVHPRACRTRAHRCTVTVRSRQRGTAGGSGAVSHRRGRRWAWRRRWRRHPTRPRHWARRGGRAARADGSRRPCRTSTPRRAARARRRRAPRWLCAHRTRPVSRTRGGGGPVRTVVGSVRDGSAELCTRRHALSGLSEHGMLLGDRDAARDGWHRRHRRQRRRSAPLSFALHHRACQHAPPSGCAG